MAEAADRAMAELLLDEENEKERKATDALRKQAGRAAKKARQREKNKKLKDEIYYTVK